MMPDLGQYAGTVLGAYGVSAVLLGGLTLISILRSARVRDALRRTESETRGRAK